jgi:small subunit ribosomal protein S19
MVDFKYKGKTLEELKKMDLKEFIELVPSRQKRSLKKGFTEQQKKLLKKIDLTLEGKYKKPIKTHCRDMIILPKMIGLMIYVHKGNSFDAIKIQPEAIGLKLGQLTLTRKKIEHSAPGIGATRSSAAISKR